MTDGPSPHLTPDELDALVSGGTLDDGRMAHLAGCAECADDAAGARRFGAAVTGRRDPAAARTPACREPEDIALFLHAPEGDQDAAAFLTHAATCDYCGPLVEAAVNATAGEDDEDRALMTQLKTAGPEWQRQMAWRFAGAQQGSAPRRSRVWTAAAWLAVAAVLVLAVRVGLTRWRGTALRPELQELVAAVGNERTRPVEGRLTGGFPYGPPPTLQRGPGEPAPPRVRIAEAKLEEAARANDTPESQAALGVGLLAIGDLDKSIDALEEAVQQKPGEARFQSDLAAAYLARAKRTDRAEDWPRALAAAERAIKADPQLTEAYFNRALALEGLQVNEEAAEAWSAYQAREKIPGWRDEAAARALKLKQRSSADQPRGNQEAREHLEDVLLAQWGEAVLAGRDPEAKQLLDEAETSAGALVAAGGDTMARDELALIRRVASNGPVRLLKTLAEGHVLYGQARVEFQGSRLQQAADLMTRAAGAFEPASSPYRFWRPVYAAIVLRVAGLSDRALKELAAMPVGTVPDTYFGLHGRYLWTRAVALQSVGRFDLERRDLEASADYFDRSREFENLCAVEAGLAEAESLLGDRHSTWRHEAAALAYVDRLPLTVRRHAILSAATSFALSEGLPETALHFQNALIRSLERAQFGATRADAYMRRARVERQLGDLPAAVADLVRAEHAIGDLDDPALRIRTIADLNRTRGDILRTATPLEAIQAIDAALDYFQNAGPMHRLAELGLLRAQASEALGHRLEAEHGFVTALNSLERDRAALASPQDRMLAFEQQRATAKELVRFQATVLMHETDALSTAERGRAQSLVTRAGGPEPLGSDVVAWGRRLPADVGIVYYVALEDRVLIWVLTKESSTHLVCQLTALRLRVLVGGLQRAIDAGASLSGAAAATRELVAKLIDPAVELARTKTRLVFVPDGALSRLPFGALPDRQGRPLIASHTITVAPSLGAFLRASSELSDLNLDGVLAIGDGHDPSTSGLPRLTVANEEAIAVGRLYPTATVLVGSAATRGDFFANERSVIHFAGHTVVNSDFPLFSRMLFAPVADENDDGMMLASEVSQHRFRRAKVVVLASCDSAGGRIIEGEGVMSLARMFIDAGVPAVIASLWPVDDESQELLLAFHRELRISLDPARALRAAQMTMVNKRPDVPLRVWGGFVSLGGLAHFTTS